MSILQNFIDILDIYGLSVPLRYQQKSKYKTMVGFILSLLTMISIITVLMIFIVDIFNHKDFSIIHNSEQIYGKKQVDFSKVPILIGFINDSGRPVKIDPKFVKITLDRNDHYPEINDEGIMKLRRESTSINLEYCDLNKHFDNDTEVIDMIKDYEYEKYLCPVPGQNLSIAGRFGDSIHGYDMLEIHLIKCENMSINDNCANEDDMENFYKNSYMSIIYLSEAVDHYDVNNPIRKSFRSEVFLVVSNSVKRYYYYFSPGTYTSDKGFLFTNQQVFNYAEYQTTIIDFVDEEDQSYYSGETLIEVAFSCMDRYVHYERTYDKLQNCFGNIGGWIRIILTICQVISDFFSEKIFLLEIINTIFPPRDIDSKLNNNTKIKDKSNNNNNIALSEGSKSKVSTNPLVSKSLFDTNKTQTNLNIVNNNIENINKINNNTQRISNINNNNKYIINKKENTRKYTFPCIDYLLPFCLLKKGGKYKAISFYKNFIYTDSSIDVIIPLIERISNINFEKENKKKEKNVKFLSKMSSTVVINNFFKNDI